MSLQTRLQALEMNARTLSTEACPHATAALLWLLDRTEERFPELAAAVHVAAETNRAGLAVAVVDLAQASGLLREFMDRGAGRVPCDADVGAPA